MGQGCRTLRSINDPVYPITESYLSDTDNIVVPFENTTPISLIHLLCDLLF